LNKAGIPLMFIP